MKIAICEDESLILRTIRQHIELGLKELSVNANFDSYTSPKKLADIIASGTFYDIFFLDIEMPEIDGIELSKQIRFYLPEALIIFISNKEELVFQTFEVRPFRFIRKNHFQEELPSVLKDIIREKSMEQSPIISIFEIGGRILSLQVNDIVYIEAMRKECLIHRKTDTICCKYKFSDFLELVRPYSFAQTHRSYIVNCRYIFRIDTDKILLDNNESIPLGRTHREDVKKEFINYAKSL